MRQWCYELEMINLSSLPGWWAVLLHSRCCFSVHPMATRWTKMMGYYYLYSFDSPWLTYVLVGCCGTGMWGQGGGDGTYFMLHGACLGMGPVCPRFWTLPVIGINLSPRVFCISMNRVGLWPHLPITSGDKWSPDAAGLISNRSARLIGGGKIRDYLNIRKHPSNVFDMGAHS